MNAATYLLGERRAGLSERHWWVVTNGMAHYAEALGLSPAAALFHAERIAAEPTYNPASPDGEFRKRMERALYLDWFEQHQRGQGD